MTVAASRLGTNFDETARPIIATDVPVSFLPSTLLFPKFAARPRGRRKHGWGRMAAQIEYREVSALRPYTNNARTHSRKQLKQIASSIERFGFTNPVLISEAGELIAGHGRVEAAKLLGIKSVPTIVLAHLTDVERRAYVLADNKLALNAGWDRDILAIELQGLIDLDFDIELIGFGLAETDFILEDAAQSDPEGSDGPEDYVPPLAAAAVTRRSDVWLLGRHKLICGDARNPCTSLPDAPKARERSSFSPKSAGTCEASVAAGSQPMDRS